MRNIISLTLIILLLGSWGCSDRSKNIRPRTVQDEIIIPPPYFISINWPAPYTVLSEGRLVITGNLQCPAGYFEEMPLAVEMYPVALIAPPLPVTTPPPTQQELQQMLESNQTVQGWMEKSRATSFRRIVEGPFVGAERWQDFTKGLSSRALFSVRFNEYNYVDFQTGDFRIDFDETARLTPGDTLLFILGQDNAGQIGIAMNIFSIPDIGVDLLAEEDAHSIAYAQRRIGLANALIEVLAVSGDDRSNEIILIQPFISFINEAYGSGYHRSTWDTAAGNLRAAAAQALNEADITNQGFITAYESVVDYIAEDYELCNFHYWMTHYVELPPGTDLLDIQQDGIQYTINKFYKYSEQYVITERGGGVKELSVQVNKGEDIIAQFTVLGDPNSPLVVLGYIGQHTIEPDDYNPYFFEILGVFNSERYDWPMMNAI